MDDVLISMEELKIEEVRKMLIRAGLTRRTKMEREKAKNHKPSHEVIDELICSGQFVEEVDEKQG